MKDKLINKLKPTSLASKNKTMDSTNDSDSYNPDSEIENKSKHNKIPSTKNYLLDQVHDKQAELKQLAKDGILSSSDYTSKSAEFILSEKNYFYLGIFWLLFLKKVTELLKK